MNVTALENSGNSSKFRIETKRGEFTIALSYTLRTKIWELPDAQAEFSAAQNLAEAIVSRHDPEQPFKPLYIFAEHNTDPSLEKALGAIRKYGYKG
jgi:hypothetical protein